MDWAKTYLLTKSAAALTAGIQAGGNLVGNAIGSAGTAIENTGRGVGNSASGAIGGAGERINRYGEWVRGSMAPGKGGGSSATAGGKMPVPVKRTTVGSPAIAKKDTPGQKMLGGRKVVADNLTANTKGGAGTPSRNTGTGVKIRQVATTTPTTKKTATPARPSPATTLQSRPRPSAPVVKTSGAVSAKKPKILASKPGANGVVRSSPATNAASKTNAGGKVKISAASQPPKPQVGVRT